MNVVEPLVHTEENEEVLGCDVWKRYMRLPKTIGVPMKRANPTRLNNEDVALYMKEKNVTERYIPKNKPYSAPHFKTDFSFSITFYLVV